MNLFSSTNFPTTFSLSRSLSLSANEEAEEELLRVPRETWRFRRRRLWRGFEELNGRRMCEIKQFFDDQKKKRSIWNEERCDFWTHDDGNYFRLKTVRCVPLFLNRQKKTPLLESIINSLSLSLSLFLSLETKARERKRPARFRRRRSIITRTRHEY